MDAETIAWAAIAISMLSIAIQAVGAVIRHGGF